MSVSVKVIPALGATVVLAEADDLVLDLGFGGDASAEVVKLFRSDRSLVIPRGNALDTFEFTVERQHANHGAAVQHLVDTAKTLRALAMKAPLVVECRMQRGSAFVYRYADAAVERTGKPRLSGIRTVQTFMIRGALTDTV